MLEETYFARKDRWWAVARGVAVTPPVLDGAMSDESLHRMASKQHAVFSRAQGLEHLSPNALRQRLDVGILEPVHECVYRVAGAPVTWRQGLMAAQLAAGEGSAIGFLAAAALWGLPDIAEGMPEVIVPAPRHVRVRGVRCHQSDRLFVHHITIRDAIQVTTPARCLFDMSAIVGPMFLGKLLNSSLRRHIVTLAELRRCCEDLATRGRRRLTLVRAVLESRPVDFDPGDSDPEVKLVRWLKSAGFACPVQQHQVALKRRLCILDLAYPEQKIAIEYDGWEFHSTRSALDRDSRRRAALTLDGWIYIGVTSAWSRDEFVETVAAAFQRSFRAEVPSSSILREKIEE